MDTDLTNRSVGGSDDHLHVSTGLGVQVNVERCVQVGVNDLGKDLCDLWPLRVTFGLVPDWTRPLTVDLTSVDVGDLDLKPHSVDVLPVEEVREPLDLALDLGGAEVVPDPRLEDAPLTVTFLVTFLPSGHGGQGQLVLAVTEVDLIALQVARDVSSPDIAAEDVELLDVDLGGRHVVLLP